MITRERIGDGFTMWFLAAVVITVTAAARSMTDVAHWAYRAAG